jgi:hypothetical protein
LQQIDVGVDPLELLSDRRTVLRRGRARLPIRCAAFAVGAAMGTSGARSVVRGARNSSAIIATPNTNSPTTSGDPRAARSAG